MTFIVIAAYVIFYCIQGSIWGWATNKIVENKGYHENWFWWGFFFGLIALIVALTKPDLPRTADSANNKRYMSKKSTYKDEVADVPAAWRCSVCGKMNANFVQICECGCRNPGR